jgi:aminoglycoside phosphotransferase
MSQMQNIVDFVTDALGCAPSRVVQLDAFLGNAVYEVDTDGRGLVVKASTNHGALRAEAWACARAAAARCAAPTILRFGCLGTGMSAMIMSRINGQPIAPEHAAFGEHILVDDGRLAGLIDWGDALIADPWFDIARFAHRSPEASLSLLLRSCSPGEDQAWRLRLYEALWMLLDACVAHGHGHRVDATLRGAMTYLSA